MKSIALFVALLFYIPATGFAAETPQLSFVTEYVRQLGVNERMRELGEKDLAEAGPDKNTAIIRSSTRINLELNSQINVLKDMTLKAPFDSLPGAIVGFYEYKIKVHDRMIDLASATEPDTRAKEECHVTPCSRCIVVRWPSGVRRIDEHFCNQNV
jgi:hypothetical protein